MGGAHRRARSVVAFVSAGLIAAVLTGATNGGAANAAGPPRVLSAAVLSAAARGTEWLAYLNGPLHTSYSPAEKLITPANATGLTQQWTFDHGAPFTASPTVTSSAVYIGGANGNFYKLSAHTGKMLNELYLGTQPALTCPAIGLSSTAAVATDPAGHVLTVYVGGADGYLYALRASNLSVEWKALVGLPSTTENTYYNWSSPTIAHGNVYVGIASNCNSPRVHGGVLAFSQRTGARVGAYYDVPAGAHHAGGDVWSSIGVAPDGDVYATSGNGPNYNPELQSAEAILKFSPALKLLGIFHVPESQRTVDGDFGGSPVFFGSYVGACNKNGVFYALRQASMKLVWWKRIASTVRTNPYAECLAAPANNGTDLFPAGGTATISGTTYPGSVQEREPGNGELVWETGLPGQVLGSPTLDGGGLLAVGTYASPGGVYLINAANGAIVEELTTGTTFAQSVFADSWLYTATSNGLTAWGLR
jgi:outer membrane protein assembly factor BamB